MTYFNKFPAVWLHSQHICVDRANGFCLRKDASKQHEIFCVPLNSALIKSSSVWCCLSSFISQFLSVLNVIYFRTTKWKEYLLDRHAICSFVAHFKFCTFLTDFFLGNIWEVCSLGLPQHHLFNFLQSVTRTLWLRMCLTWNLHFWFWNDVRLLNNILFNFCWSNIFVEWKQKDGGNSPCILDKNANSLETSI